MMLFNLLIDEDMFRWIIAGILIGGLGLIKVIVKNGITSPLISLKEEVREFKADMAGIVSKLDALSANTEKRMDDMEKRLTKAEAELDKCIRKEQK